MPSGGAAGGRHLVRRLLEVHDPPADLGDAVLGHDEDVLAEARVEAPRDVAHELEVLALVLADGHLVGAVGEHVGGLQHRVEEQRGGDQLALAHRLVAELVHAVELADGGHRRQQPGQLGVLVHVALAEEHAALGIQARGQQQRQQVVEPGAQLGGVVGEADRVQVDDAVDRRVAAVLALRPTGGWRRCSCRGACGPWAGCPRRCARADKLAAQRKRKAGAPLRQALEHLGGDGVRGRRSGLPLSSRPGGRMAGPQLLATSSPMPAPVRISIARFAPTCAHWVGPVVHDPSHRPRARARQRLRGPQRRLGRAARRGPPRRPRQGRRAGALGRGPAARPGRVRPLQARRQGEGRRLGARAVRRGAPGGPAPQAAPACATPSASC